MTLGVELTVALALARTAILVLGALVTYYAYKAYSRTGAPGLRALAIGFGFVVAGSVVGGVVHASGVDVSLALLADSALTAVGFALILYSLYADA
ncbi:MAG: hypothetical protein U5J64_05225 [Halobacteriales archaeon]|nr:hypothetical protein [Halobacteriales archaeon]